jgi:hypothetical protein
MPVLNIIYRQYFHQSFFSPTFHYHSLTRHIIILLAMSSSGSTYCTFTVLLQIQKLDSPARAYSIALTAVFATSPAGELVAEIDSPDRIAIPVEHYNDSQEQEFLNNAYFFCIGTLAIDTADATSPVLSIKAIQVLV